MIADNCRHHLGVERIISIWGDHNFADEEKRVKKTTAVTEPVKQPIGRSVNQVQVPTEAHLNAGEFVECVGVGRSGELVPSTWCRLMHPLKLVEEILYLISQLYQLGFVLK